MDIKEGLLLWSIIFQIKSPQVVHGVNIPLEFNEQLAKKLRKRIIRNFKKRTVCSGSKDNNWGAD